MATTCPTVTLTTNPNVDGGLSSSANHQQVIVINVPQDVYGNNDYPNEKSEAYIRRKMKVTTEVYIQAILLICSILMMAGVLSVLLEFRLQHGRYERGEHSLWRFIGLLFYMHYVSDTEITPAITLITPCILISIVVIIVAKYKYKMKEDAKIDIFQTILKITVVHAAFYVAGHFALDPETMTDTAIRQWITYTLWYVYVVIQTVVTVRQSFNFAVHSGFEKTRVIGLWGIVFIKLAIIVSFFLYAECIVIAIYRLNPQIGIEYLYASGSIITIVWATYIGVFFLTRNNNGGIKNTPV